MVSRHEARRRVVLSSSMPHDERYDQGLRRLEAFGPECMNGFSNHGSMAIEALANLGRSECIDGYLQRYIPGLAPAGKEMPPISASEVDTSLGKAPFARWLATFRRELDRAPLEEVVRVWTPKLIPGCAAAAFHGPLMALHALRALESGHTEPRLEAFARGLAYWAATYLPLPGSPSHSQDGVPLHELIATIPVADGPKPGAIDAAIVHRTKDNAEFAQLVSRPRAIESDGIAVLTEAGARALLAYPGGTVIFTHTVTGPAAFRTLSRWLDPGAMETAIDYLWRATAAILATFSGPEPLPTSVEALSSPVDAAALVRSAIGTGDEHAIKLVEAALGEYATTDRSVCLQAAQVATRQLGAD